MLQCLGGVHIVLLCIGGVHFVLQCTGGVHIVLRCTGGAVLYSVYTAITECSSVETCTFSVQLCTDGSQFFRPGTVQCIQSGAMMR